MKGPRYFRPFSRIWFVNFEVVLVRLCVFKRFEDLFVVYEFPRLFLRCCCKLPFSFLPFGFVVYLKCCFLCKARRSRVLVVLRNAHGGTGARVCLSGGADLRQRSLFIGQGVRHAARQACRAHRGRLPQRIIISSSSFLSSAMCVGLNCAG